MDASWEEAMSLVAEKFAAAIKTHGADSVAYYGSGQCLSEESYLGTRRSRRYSQADMSVMIFDSYSE